MYTPLDYQTSFDDFVGREVFVVGKNLINDKIVTTEYIYIVESCEELLSLLEDYKVSEAEEILVLHGVLNTANKVPNDLLGVGAFLLMVPRVEEDSIPEGLICDIGDGVDGLQVVNAIELLLSPETSEMDQGIGHFITDINEIYILYGYKIDLKLSVDIESIDSSSIHYGLKLIELTKSMKET